HQGKPARRTRAGDDPDHTGTGAYEFRLVDGDGEHPLDPFSFRLEPDPATDPHVDVLARPTG
ncbi:MAG: hypothetical protein M3227_08480, partial [Thermoproteota archaeon]|nr:hypothetical protein [Thermoproteota archaeon]